MLEVVFTKKGQLYASNMCYVYLIIRNMPNWRHASSVQIISKLSLPIG